MYHYARQGFLLKSQVKTSDSYCGRMIVTICLFLFFIVTGAVYAGSLSPIGPSGGLLVTNIMGADSDLIAICPPPGLYLLNYNFYYFADHFTTRSGKNVHNGILKDFEADIYGEIARVAYVPKRDIRILGGKWMSDIAFPVIYKGIKTTLFDKSKTGLGDIVFCPVNLFYQWGNFYSLIYLDFIAPTGRYEKYGLVNIGNNHWTFEPAAYFTYWKEPWEVTGGYHFSFNTKNNDFIDPRSGKETSHKPGEAFYIDYGVSRTVKPELGGLRIGLNGYLWKDISLDEVDGHSVSDTMTEVFAIGPSVRWTVKAITFCLKGQFEVYAQNRPQGQFLWLKIIYRL